MLLRFFSSFRLSRSPNTWHVIRPRIPVGITTILFVLCIGVGFNLFFAIGGAGVLYDRHPDHPVTNFFAAYTHFPLVAILVQLAVLGEAMLVRYDLIRQKDAVLVLLPGGICQCTDVSKTQRRRMKLMGYSTIQQITLDVLNRSESRPKKVATLNLNAFDPGALQQSQSVPTRVKRCEFHFIYRDGTRETWIPAGGYEHFYAEIAQWILADYRAFTLGQRSKQ
jgi:hypothetical protein